MWSLEPNVNYLLSEFLHFPIYLLQLFKCVGPYLIDLRGQIRTLSPVHPLCLLEPAGHVALNRRLRVLYLGQLPLEHASHLLELGDLSPHLPLEKLHLLLALLETFTLVADDRLLLNYFQHVVHSSLHSTQGVLYSAVLVF